MKELSIEDKAKAYDEAIEKARKIQNNPYTAYWDLMKELVVDIFPELKEREDGLIKKAIVTVLKEVEEHIGRGYVLVDNKRVENSEIIAWLEKQESCYTFEIERGYWYKCICDYMLNGSDLMFKNGKLYYCRSDWRLESEIDERNVKDIGVNGYKSFFRPATNQEIKNWLEKQGEQKPYGQREECSNCEFRCGDKCIGSCSMKRSEQKSAWSEEDEKEVAVLEAYIRSKD